jgi:nucleoside-diphosphate-sugar epimerase
VGPTYNKTPFTSADLVAKILNEKIPAMADLQFGCVDVRNVAEAHVAAMTNGSMDGKRVLHVENSYTFEEIVSILRSEFEGQGWKLVNRKAGFCSLKLFSYFDSDVKAMLPYVGKRIKFDNTRSVKELGIEFIPMKQSFVDMGYSLIERGFVADKRIKKECFLTSKK